MSDSKAGPGWDAFISYASEDRALVVQPLVDALQSLGLRIWFDQTELRVGDSLRGRIDVGLAQSRYGIVVLSPAFFAKHYPVRELDGLAQREVAGEKVLLPVWHDVDEKAVRRFSPPLADRIAARWTDGIDAVVHALFQVIGAQLLAEVAEASKRIHDLAQAKGGSDLIAAMHGAHAHSFVHDEFESADEVALVGDFLQTLEDWIDALDEVGASERAKLAFELTRTLRELDSQGWKVFAGSLHEQLLSGLKELSPVSCVAVVRKDRQSVARIDGKFAMIKGKQEPSEGVVKPSSEAYADTQARYLGGHPQFDHGAVGTVIVDDAGINFSAADNSMQLSLQKSEICSAVFRMDKLHFEQAEFEEGVFIDPDATLLRPIAVVTVTDPEEIVADGLRVRFAFRNEYQAKVFVKKLCTRFGIVTPGCNPPDG